MNPTNPNDPNQQAPPQEPTPPPETPTPQATPNPFGPAPAPSQPTPPQSEPMQPVTPEQPSAPLTPTPHSNKGLMIGLIIGAVVLLLVIGAIVFATMNSQGNTSNSTADTSTAEEEMTEEPAEEVVTIPQSEREVNQTLNDDELGHSVTATKVVINPFPIPEQYAENNSDKVVVLVEYTATNDGQYTGAPSATSIKLVTEDGEDVNSTTLSADDLEAAGYIAAPSSGPSLGESDTGYVAYWVPIDQAEGSLGILYERREVNVINGDGFDARTFAATLY